MHSRLYHGHIHHSRHTPKQHRFTYPLFMLYLDLDELDQVFTGARFWSVDKKNLAAFFRTDHMGGKNQNLKEAVIEKVFDKTGLRCDGPVRLLTHARYWGYVFNPVSFFYCFDKNDEHVIAVLAEVNNTPWGEQHCYVLPVSADARNKKVWLHHEEKTFHVSPFMDEDMTYEWRFVAPGEHINIAIKNHQKDKVMFEAHLALEEKPITPANLNRILIRFPFMSFSIILRIYWQALKLWLKGIPYVPYPDKKSAKTHDEFNNTPNSLTDKKDEQHAA